MQLRKFRWSKVYESSEEELQSFLDSRSITAERHKLEEFEDLGGVSFEHDTIWWVADGSMTLQFAETKFSLQAGDTIHIPANNAFTGTTGMSGCAYYQAA